jgi:hypothetical protein
MVYLTEETFTYVINGADRDYNLSTPGPNKNDDEKYRNIMLSEDFAIYMNSRLDSSVREYYCEVIQYTYNHYNDGLAETETLENVNFTQLYSDLIETGEKPKHMLCNQARYPLTQMSSTKNNTDTDNTYNGFTRNNVNQKQNNTFVCNNFNQQHKYFRMASMRYNGGYGFIDVGTYAEIETYGTAQLSNPYGINLFADDATYVSSIAELKGWLKSYPSVIMYMTPIYADKIPRLLNENNTQTLTISSYERTSGENGFGVDCVIPISPFNSKYKKFKAVFQSLDIVGGMNISVYDRHMCNFPFHFVCYDWDKRNYGYGGDQKGNGFILTTTPITFNFQTNPDIVSKLSIDNELHNRDIRFQFLLPQMHKPTTNEVGINTHGFLHSGKDVVEGYRALPNNVGWEWILTLKLYGIE